MAKIVGKSGKYFKHNRIQLIHSGSSFFSAVYTMLDEAKEEIHFQTYIFEEDETGRQMADALIRTAERGIRVYLLADAYGSRNLSEATIQKMKNAGVKVRLFGPLLSKGKIHFGRRLHQKIVLCDQRKAIISGVNISNNYSGIGGNHPWLDFAVLVEGDVIPSLAHITVKTWLGFSMQNWRKKFEKSILPLLKTDDTYRVFIRALENDGLRGRYQCAAAYLRLLNSTNDTAYIVGGYFLPGGRGRRALKRAIHRGVRIRVVVAEKSDVGLMHQGMLYLYSWLLRNRIEIFEYKPSNVHGKVLVTDEKYVCIGSYDLNNLSTYSNIELNLEINDQPFAGLVKADIENIIATQCHPVTMTELVSRFSLWNRLVQWVSYRLLKVMFVLAVWLATKENEQL